MEKVLILILTILICAFFLGDATAQGFVAKGLRGGINLANVRGDNAEDTDYRIGFAIGGFLTYNLNEQFCLRPEVYFASKGFKSEEKVHELGTNYSYSYSSKASVNLNYLEFHPLLIVFYLNKNINLFAGPYLDVYLNGKVKSIYESHIKYLDPLTNEWITKYDECRSASENIESDDMNSLGYGLLFGVEYVTGQISLGVRYSLGLSNILDNDDMHLKHKVIQLLVGFSFP